MKIKAAIVEDHTLEHLTIEDWETWYEELHGFKDIVFQMMVSLVINHMRRRTDVEDATAAKLRSADSAIKRYRLMIIQRNEARDIVNEFEDAHPLLNPHQRNVCLGCGHKRRGNRYAAACDQCGQTHQSDWRYPNTVPKSKLCMCADCQLQRDDDADNEEEKGAA